LGALGKAQGQIDARSAITGNEIVTNVQSVNGLTVSSGVIDAVGYLTLSQSYTIQTLGTTSNAQWNTIAGTTNVAAGSFVPGRTYVIVSPGTTDFTLIGAANNTIGTSFIALGAGTGSGTALQTYLVGSTFTCANIGTSMGTGTAFRITNTTAQLVTSGAFVITATYIIQSIGTTDFTLIGAASNTIGLSFVATGVGAGTGKAYRVNSLGLSGSVVLPVAPTIVSPTISGAVMNTMASSVLTSKTAQAASGATVSFTGIPSWAKRITVLLSGVVTVSSGLPAIRAGAGSYEATGYSSTNNAIGTSSVTSSLSATTSWDLQNSGGSANVYSGQLVITRLEGYLYTIAGQIMYSTSGATALTTGYKTFSGNISQLQLRMSTGTDTFNGGTMNIMWE
jgi:hypothetical protein